MPELNLGKVVGPQGPQGATGPTGAQGIQGIQGEPGEAGKSAYQAAKDGGYTGTEADFNAIMAIIHAHAGRHKTGGADPLTAADVGAVGVVPTQIPVGGTDVLLLPPGRYTIDGVENVEQAYAMNLPVGAWHWEIEVLAMLNKDGITRNFKTIYAYPNTGEIWVNTVSYSENGSVIGWQRLATTDYALPRDGSAEMTGTLTLADWGGGTHKTQLMEHGDSTHIRHYQDDLNYISLFWSITQDLLLSVVKGGVQDNHTILHTGNKPSGSYWGNGDDDADVQTISIGGIGKYLAMHGGGYTILVGASGSFGGSYDGQNIAFASSKCKFENGVLTVVGKHDAFNKDGIEYRYQLL